jgi:ribosomal 50S subunit-associated protein YjgA (DUF615 family)
VGCAPHGAKALADFDLEYPEVDQAKLRELAAAKKKLLSK